MHKLISRSASKTPQTLAVRVKSEATIVMDKSLYEVILYFVKLSPQECLWHCCIERDPASTEELLVYRVSDLFIPEQTVADKECEASPQQMIAMWKEVKETRGLDNAAYGKLASTARFWGHSHVQMGISPSSQDITQWEDMIEAVYRPTNVEQHPCGMVILNQREEQYTRIYDPKYRFEFTNVPILVDDTLDYSYVEDALKNKVKKASPKTTFTTVTTPSPTTSHASSSWLPKPAELLYSDKASGNGGSPKAGIIVTPTTSTLITGSGSAEVTSEILSSDDSALPAGSTVRGLLPLSWLSDPEVRRALDNLDKLRDTLMEKFDLNGIIRLAIQINRLSSRQEKEINQCIDQLVNKLTLGKEGKRAGAIHDLGLATQIMATVESTMDMKLAKVIDAVLMNTKNYHGKLTEIAYFFAGHFCECPELLVFAISIAILYGYVKNDDDTPTKNKCEAYTDAYARIHRKVLQYKAANAK